MNLLKNKNRILCFILLIWTQTTKANSILGGEIYYTYKGNSVYEITANIFRNCKGIPLKNMEFIAVGKGNNGGQMSLNLQRTQIKDITPICSYAKPPCYPSNSTVNSGTEQHTFVGTVDLNNSPLGNWINNGCCLVTFYAKNTGRDSSFTTINPGDSFVISASIDFCQIKNTSKNSNSNAQIPHNLKTYCCNLPVYLPLAGIDTLDYDSVSYELTAPKVNLKDSGVKYIQPYTSKIPLQPYCIPSGVSCTPSPYAKPARGFSLNNNTGDMVFTPTKCLEIALIGITINEYRKDKSGSYIWIGNSNKEIFINVSDQCGYNNAPKVEGPTSNKICEGDEICIKIKSTDETFTPQQTIPDTTVLVWNRGIPGAKFSIIDPKAREKEAEFCWKTKDGDGRDVAYSFSVTATDNHCPMPLSETKIFKITVNSRAKATRFYTCSNGNLFLNSISSIDKGNNNYSWSIRDSSNLEIKKSNKQTDTLKLPYYGKFYILHTINNSICNAPRTSIDTLYCFDIANQIKSFKNNLIQVFPNPSKEFFNIQNSSKYRIMTSAIYDLNGKVLFFTNPNQSINVSHLSSGIYLLKIELENKVIIYNKVIIEKH